MNTPHDLTHAGSREISELCGAAELRSRHTTGHPLLDELLRGKQDAKHFEQKATEITEEAA